MITEKSQGERADNERSANVNPLIYDKYYTTVQCLINYYWSLVILFDMSKINSENVRFIRLRQFSDKKKANVQ